MTAIRSSAVAFVLAVVAACRNVPERVTETQASSSVASSQQPSSQMDEAPVLADDCPQPAPPVNDEIAAQAAALVPLKPGLTLATAWHRTTQNDDVECLTHIHEIDASTIAASANCSM